MAVRRRAISIAILILSKESRATKDQNTFRTDWLWKPCNIPGVDDDKKGCLWPGEIWNEVVTQYTDLYRKSWIRWWSISCSACVLAAQPCLTLYDPEDGRPPGPSVHGILQARTLECLSFPSASSVEGRPVRGSSFGVWSREALPFNKLVPKCATQKSWLVSGSMRLFDLL